MAFDRYQELKVHMERAFEDLSILAGDEIGPPDATWQDVAGTAAVNLHSLARLIEAIREGKSHYQGVPLEGTAVFPSPLDVLEVE